MQDSLALICTMHDRADVHLYLLVDTDIIAYWSSRTVRPYYLEPMLSKYMTLTHSNADHAVAGCGNHKTDQYPRLNDFSSLHQKVEVQSCKVVRPV